MTTTAHSTNTAPFDAASTVQELRATFDSGRTRPLKWRLEQLQGLLRFLEECQTEILDAVHADLNKPSYEGWLGEIGASKVEVKHLIKHLPGWMKPEKIGVPMWMLPSKAEVRREPLGTVLVIAPWNYPIYLLLTPLAAALSAGNCVVVKPSEVSSASSSLIARRLPEFLDADAVRVVEGGVDETTALLEQRFDHILYTGGPGVGRIVATAAAKHLTPVTLELGGKSPVIVDKHAPLDLAAKRIAFAKWGNAGQTCIAVDHVFVHRDVEAAFAKALAKEVKNRYGSEPRKSPDFGRVINANHTQRVASLIDAGGFDEIAFGGEVDVEARYIAPTLLRGARLDSKVMSEEIFGPVLPMVTFDDASEPIAAINAGEKPLALYVFSKDPGFVDRVLAETSAGGVCVNEVMMHVFVSGLPFGGVGESGYGAYHGKWGFDTFSHRKSIVRRPTWLPELPAMRAPYKPWKLGFMKKAI